MGSLIHPVAERIREAARNRDFKQAGNLLATGLEQDPGNPDIVCELAILRMVQGREAEAFELVPVAAQGQRAEHLIQMLCNYQHCRLLLDEHDFDAAKRLHLLGAYEIAPSSNVGIKVSACLIVKNEEQNLARCLSSLRGAVDEIVVVDTGSTDTTVEIAEQFGAVLGRFEWCDDFSAARNHALDLATGNWALWIDADEELSPESFHAIRRAIVRPHFGGFDIEIVNFLDDRPGGEEVRHCPTRLFRHIPEVRFTGRIHEQMTPSLIELNLPWTRLEGAKILHYGYRPEEMERKSKLVRTVEMLEREVRENPNDAFHWFNLANAYLIANRLPEAEHAASQSVKKVGPKAPFGSQAYHILMQAASGSGNQDRAIAAGAEADTRGYASILTSFELCQALLRASRPQDALEESEKLLQMEWTEGSSGDRGIFTHKRLVLRAQILAVVGRFEEALSSLEEALSFDPNFSVALYSRGAVLEKLGRLSEALDSFTRAASDSSSFHLAMKGCGRALVGVGRPIEAAVAFRQAWERSPEDLDAWIGWTGACEASGDIRAVLEAYEAFARVHEPTAEVFINWGRALEAAGEYDRALHCFAEAIKRDPLSSNGYFNCGDLLYRLGAINDAVHLYQAALQISPGHADGWFTLGNAYAKMGMTPKAIESYEQALARNPRHDGARHNLGVLKEDSAATATAAA